MNFSQLIQQSNDIVRYSPSGDLVAIAKTFEVKVHYIIANTLIDL